jgi:hypothetical protein
VFNPGDKIICNSTIPLWLSYRQVYTVEAASELGVKVAENNQWYANEYFVLAEDKPNTVDEGLVMPTASKNDKDKIDLSLIPAVSLREHAKAFMVGEKKYGRYNYCKGHKASQLVAAAMRHLTAWFEREDHDPIDGQHHLGSVMACCSMILRQQELETLKDDRYEDIRKK